MQSGLQKNRSQMIFNHLSRPVSALVLVLGLHAMSVPQSAFAQTTAANKEVSTASVTQSGKKLIGHEVYANWRSIQNAIVSRDGLWAAYAMVGQESDGEIVLKNLRDGKEWRAPRAPRPALARLLAGQLPVRVGPLGDRQRTARLGSAPEDIEAVGELGHAGKAWPVTACTARRPV